MTKFIQFQLWRQCSSNCDFCYLKGIKDTSNKLDAIEQTIQFIQALDFSEYSEIGITGGELFDLKISHQYYQQLLQLFDVLARLLQDKKIKKVYITASLLYKDLSLLIDCLDTFKHYHVSNKVLLCTSYDTKYRFKNEASERLWKQNMLELYRVYPEVLLHTEIICSQDFIIKVLNNEFSVKDLEKSYHTKVNYIKPQCNTQASSIEEFDKQLPEFVLHRADFLKFLKKCKAENLLEFNELFNYSLHSDTYVYFTHDNKMKVMKDRQSHFVEGCLAISKSVGRDLSVLEYIDSDASIDDDVNFFKEL